jgi:hypothetical protein
MCLVNLLVIQLNLRTGTENWRTGYAVLRAILVRGANTTRYYNDDYTIRNFELILKLLGRVLSSCKAVD